MSEPILTVLKFFLLALVWLFFLRILRSVWVEIRTTARAADGGGGRPAARPGAIPAANGPRPPAGPRQPAVPVAPVGAPPTGVVAPAGSGSRPGRVATRTELRVVEPASEAGRAYPVDGQAVIGRSGSSDIALASDSYVSSRHARLWIDGEGLWIEDLGSTNGSLVNGRRVEAPVRLRKGDRVSVGRTTFEVGGA